MGGGSPKRFRNKKSFGKMGKWGMKESGAGSRAPAFSGRTFTGPKLGEGSPSEPGEGPNPEMQSRAAQTVERRDKQNAVDEKFGFKFMNEGPSKLGWLLNMGPTSVKHSENEHVLSAIDMYFVQKDGSRFKATMPYAPYFYVAVKEGHEREVEAHLRQIFGNLLLETGFVEKEDLDMLNHLAGLRKQYLKLSFRNVNDLMEVRKVVLPFVEKNRDRNEQRKEEEIETMMNAELSRREGGVASESLIGNLDSTMTATGIKKLRGAAATGTAADLMNFLVDIREYDVKYHIRAAIDKNIRVGLWYECSFSDGHATLKARPDLEERPHCKICAWDIECTKQPLKFPNAEVDQIMMISYMVDRQGYLITNRSIIAEEIPEFEYTPKNKPEYEGPFKIFNEKDERALLKRFFSHLREEQPDVFVTFNGDFFDWPFVEKRAEILGMSMRYEIGFGPESQGANDSGAIYRSRHASHLDCYAWVQRDSYLPQGSQGLKAVCKAKLGYDPLELDPEDMTRLAAEDPFLLSSYSVSDAVATYYLYMKYVHPFIFSLCTIIPLPPDEVLRKGSGTLCELLLMVQAYSGNIVCPNRQVTPGERFYRNHPLESETYIGGHVDQFESGIFRSDIEEKFRLDPTGYQFLIDEVDSMLKFTIEKEGNYRMDQVTNYEEVRSQVVKELEALRDIPTRKETPYIYHLDVGAMYPNIILTNRLQPCSMVDDSICASCVHNTPESDCQRKMRWVWRGEYLKLNKAEYDHIKSQLEAERFPAEWAKSHVQSARPSAAQRCTYHDLPKEKQQSLLKKRVGEYCQKVYKKTRVKEQEFREATICQRENSFYVDTVRLFRDRRYEFKSKLKVWRTQFEKAQVNRDALGIESASGMMVLYDSLQLAHKCILNSFYGYVMRKGARWYSMQMAGVVTHTGANIIKLANDIVTKVGKPLELDTDGIWCCLPGSFPDKFTFNIRKSPDDEKLANYEITYPCVMLNAMVDQQFTNSQYQELKDEKNLVYEKRSENSIYFEVDGPYRAMVLPAAREEGKALKKRYAVFNFDGTLAELKGFEIKRRGELKLIKIFQSQVFETFLQGKSLTECYAAVGKVGNHWIDVLEERGQSMDDDELVDLISESTTMSRTMDEYEGRKSLAITTAKRLGELLGMDTSRERGLKCQYVISKKPMNRPVTERAIPITVYHTEVSIRNHFLRKWCKEIQDDSECELRELIDWNYYKERLGNAIQKIVTIPAAFQNVKNPVPRVEHPAWLEKKLREKSSQYKQQSLTGFFKKVEPGEEMDLEDIGGAAASTLKKRVVAPITMSVGPGAADTSSKKRRKGRISFDVEGEAPEMPESMKKFFEPDHGFGREFYNHEDFQKWLSYAKYQWRQLRKQKKARRQQQQAEARGMSLGRPGAGAITNNREKLFHILQISERPAQAGLLDVWAYVTEFSGSGQLRTFTQVLRVRTPRRFYLHSRVSDAMSTADRLESTAVLPRNKPKSYLYEYNIDENLFQQNEHMIRKQTLVKPEIEGVYECQIPLAMRLLTSTGAAVVKNKQSRTTAATAMPVTASSDWIGAAPIMSSAPSAMKYLQAPGEAHPLDLVYLYVLTMDAGRRGVVCYIDRRSNTCKTICILNERRAERPRVDARLRWKSILEKMQIDAGEYGADAVFPGTQGDVLEYVRTLPAALKVLQRDFQELTTFHSRGTTMASADVRPEAPPVLALHVASASDFEYLQSTLPLIRDGAVPYVAMPFNDEDISALPPLNWQPKAVELAMKRFFELQTWWRDRLELCRFTHIPFCNIVIPKLGRPVTEDGDSYLSAIDVLYSRMLNERRMVSWYSDRRVPDLGGEEDDISQQIGYLSEEVDNPSIVNSGAYRTVCLEFNMRYLAINCILQSQYIAEAEGESGLGFDIHPQTLKEIEERRSRMQQSQKAVEDHFGSQAPDAADDVAHVQSASATHAHSWDETAMCADAFRVLKHLVHVWFKEVQETGSPVADALLEHMYRWIRTPRSKFYDPLLHRLIHKRMRKLLLKLLVELQRLGARVVHASFHRVVIATTKNDLKEALSYTRYLLQTLENNNLFKYIHIEPVNVWDYLLYMDVENHGGVQFECNPDLLQAIVDPTTSAEDYEKHMRSLLDSSERTIASHWILSRHLPERLEDQWSSLVGRFVERSYETQVLSRDKLKRNEFGANVTAGDDDDEGGLTSLSSQFQGTPAERKAYRWLLGRIRGQILKDDMTKSLYALIPQIRKHVVAEDSSGGASLFPMRVGSHLTMTDPALEFVKFVCAVLGLEKELDQDVQILKRNLLRLIGIREFADEAQFTNPSLSLVVPDVFCDFCNRSADIDLCRDPSMDPSQYRGGGAHKWRCQNCGSGYSKAAIEAELLDAVQRINLCFQLQDQLCQKCHDVRVNMLSEYCEKCSSIYCPRYAAEEFRKRLRRFLNVAEANDLTRLLNTVAFLMR